MLKDVNIGIEEEIGILITLFQLGGDYGQAWEGNINIEDMDIYMYEQPPAGQGLACLYLNGADFGSTDLTRDCYLGKKNFYKES